MGQRGDNLRRVPGSQTAKPIVFLDRDGVLNADRGYIFRWEDFTWMPQAREAVRWLNENGYIVIVVTNQSGIARGLYSEEQYLELTRSIEAELHQAGAHIDAIYFCPHHPTAGEPPYRRECDCRKPLPGMLLRGFNEFGGDRRRSLLIGNSPRDIEAAKAAGIPGYMYADGSLLEFVKKIVGAN